MVHPRLLLAALLTGAMTVAVPAVANAEPCPLGQSVVGLLCK
jgi:hypothetical protein